MHCHLRKSFPSVVLGFNYETRMSLVILGMGSSGRLNRSSLGEEPCATVVWSPQKLRDAVCEERNSNGKNSVKSLTSLPCT